ncbi:MAG TPA: universal stress protein [Hyphomicrobiaceae bacterium]|nr:universal stress protein [Hyphomicrobiaceae bacterium]
MFKNMLIATDGSELAESAASQGIELARVLDAKLTVVTVTEPWNAVVTGEAAFGFARAVYENSAIETATTILARIVAMAKSAGIRCKTVHVKDRFPDEGIIAAAKDNGCDVVVMASHGRRGLARFLLGSVASRVVTLNLVPVLICRSSS